LPAPTEPLRQFYPHCPELTTKNFQHAKISSMYVGTQKYLDKKTDKAALYSHFYY